jgi:hypothetical protein
MSTHNGRFSVNKMHKYDVLTMLGKLANEMKTGISWKVTNDPGNENLVSIDISWPQAKADAFYMGFLIGMGTMEIVYENKRDFVVKKTHRQGPANDS